jgi:hypothetical protein
MTLPHGWLSYRNAQRKSAAATAGVAQEAGAGTIASVVGEAAPPQPSPPLAAEHPPHSERPTRLN